MSESEKFKILKRTFAYRFADNFAFHLDLGNGYQGRIPPQILSLKIKRASLLKQLK